MRIYKLVFIVLIAVLAANTAAFAEVSAFMPSEQFVSARMLLSVDKLRPGDTFQVAVRATVKKDYHIGAHDKDALYQANLTLAAPKGITLQAPKYPEPLRKAFAFAPGKKLPVYEGTFVITANGTVSRNAKPGPITLTAKLDTQACKGAQCFPPQTIDLKLKTDVAPAGTMIKKINTDIFKTAGGTLAGFEGKLANMPLAFRFLMLYGLGLLLAFTPCVYPMVPVTVGYFSTQGESKTRKVVLLAGVYVLGLALTYSVLGAAAATAGGMFGAAMQSPAVLVGIAIILVALALSMFGLYELQAPSFIQSRSSGRSGIAGALFMGLIFGVVAAPCVGPVVLGLMAYVAHLGSPTMGFLLFFALALGIGTPLFALATFSAKLPLPGMWMVAVKKAAGFLLIGAAAYFLTPILPELIGKFMLPAVVLAGAVYLGFFEKSIRTNRLATGCGRTIGTAGLIVAIAMAMPKPKAPSIQWQPYKPAGITTAAKSHKPVMIDFTAKWCAACQELEHGPFSDPTVIKAASRFQRFRVDGTDRSDPKMLAASKRFNVSGFPTVIFIDSSGKEVNSARIIGFVNSKDMLRRIDSVK